MPTAFVTGGTGFLGLNLVRELKQRDWDVVACHRASSRLEHIKRFDPTLVVAELTDTSSVADVMPEAVDAVFHVAADVNFWKLGNASQTRTNVDGTLSVVNAALRRKAKRFIHTSSIAAWGTPAHHGAVISEETPSRAAGHWINYFRTKHLAQEIVKRRVDEGLDAVILNPANIVGPYDHQNWSRSFRLLKERRLPGVPPGGGAFCHVKHVVDAHIAAVEKGRSGECYLLGGPHATYAEVFEVVAELVGTTCPRAIPAFMMRAVGRVSEWASYATKRAPDVTPEIAELLGSDFAVDSSKAKRELAYGEATLQEMFEDCYAWMQRENMA